MGSESAKYKQLSVRQKICNFDVKKGEVVLFPELTNAFIGTVDDRGIVRALYCERKTINHFISEGMSKEDAVIFLNDNTKKTIIGGKNYRKEPLFVSTLEYVD